MNLNDLCPGDMQAIRVRLERPMPYGVMGMANWLGPEQGYFEHGQRPRRMRCQTCGRKVFSRIVVDHDGLEVYHVIPAHKPKGWWKKGKKGGEHAR